MLEQKQIIKIEVSVMWLRSYQYFSIIGSYWKRMYAYYSIVPHYYQTDKLLCQATIRNIWAVCSLLCAIKIILVSTRAFFSDRFNFTDNINFMIITNFDTGRGGSFPPKLNVISYHVGTRFLRLQHRVNWSRQQVTCNPSPSQGCQRRCLQNDMII